MKSINVKQLLPCVVAVILVAAITTPLLSQETSSVIQPFNGKNLEGWKTKAPAERSHWKVGKAKLADDASKLAVSEAEPAEAELVNAEGRGVDIYTEGKFGDCRLTLEFMVPKGSNSGIYVMGEYEVQILDSFGKERVGPGDVGGLYGAAAPSENAAKMPGQWQKFEIEFQAPRFEGDKKTANAVFKRVVLNGKVIHENVEMKGPTPSGVTGREAPTGPLMFQGDHGAVAYRNIDIEPR